MHVHTHSYTYTHIPNLAPKSWDRRYFGRGCQPIPPTNKRKANGDILISDVEMVTRLCSLIAGAHMKQRLVFLQYYKILFYFRRIGNAPLFPHCWCTHETAFGCFYYYIILGINLIQTSKWKRAFVPSLLVHTQNSVWLFLLYYFRDQFISDEEMETGLCSLIAGAHTKQRLKTYHYYFKDQFISYVKWKRAFVPSLLHMKQRLAFYIKFISDVEMETRLCYLIAGAHMKQHLNFILLYYFKDQFISDAEMETGLCSLIAGAHTKQRSAFIIIIIILFKGSIYFRHRNETRLCSLIAGAHTKQR